jgi:hypothetical protein
MKKPDGAQLLRNAARFTKAEATTVYFSRLCGIKYARIAADLPGRWTPLRVQKSLKAWVHLYGPPADRRHPSHPDT